MQDTLDRVSPQEMEKALINAIFDAVRRQDERRLSHNRWAEEQEARLRATLRYVRKSVAQGVQP